MFDTHELDEAIEQRRVRLLAEQSKLQEIARRSLLSLRDEHGLQAAYIVGSLAEPGLWQPESDVDVAVRGRQLDVLEVMRVLEEATGRDVDVIDLNRHPAPAAVIRAAIRVYG
jgi:predicted nucleotidyltransferase